MELIVVKQKLPGYNFLFEVASLCIWYDMRYETSRMTLPQKLLLPVSCLKRAAQNKSVTKRGFLLARCIAKL